MTCSPWRLRSVVPAGSGLPTSGCPCFLLGCTGRLTPPPQFPSRQWPSGCYFPPSFPDLALNMFCVLFRGALLLTWLALEVPSLVRFGLEGKTAMN